MLFFFFYNVSFVYLDLKNKTEVVIELTSELLEEYTKKLVDIIKKIETEDFVKNNKDCKCEYNIICY